MLFNDKDIKTMVENLKKGLRREMDALNHDIRGLVRKMNSTQIDQNTINMNLAKSIEAGADATLELANTVEEMAKKIQFLEDRLLTLEMKRLQDHEPIVINPAEPNIDPNLLKNNRGILDCPQIICDTTSEEIGYINSTVSVFANDKESVINELADILDGPDTIQE